MPSPNATRTRIAALIGPLSEQMYGPWFGESEAELQAIEEVEIDPARGAASRRRDARRFPASLEAARGAGADAGKRRRVLGVAWRPKVPSAHEPCGPISNSPRVLGGFDRVRVCAFPGGSIVVMCGLVDFAESEAAPWAYSRTSCRTSIMGISCADSRHELAQEGWRGGQRRELCHPDGPPPNIMLMTKQFVRPFRSEDETAADRDAAEWMHKLG